MQISGAIQSRDVPRRFTRPNLIHVLLQTQRPLNKSRFCQRKPPAILIRLVEGRSFEDTDSSIRSRGLPINDIGTNVTMRETRDGNLLVELTNEGQKSETAAKTRIHYINYYLIIIIMVYITIILLYYCY